MSAIPLYTSIELVPEQVYTRQYLRNLFGIIDNTINTGVFNPRGTKSVWLFVTEEKSADQTPYLDSLHADTLNWQGQLSGRTDKLIFTHKLEETELLVFYRKSKQEHPGSGFRYLGRFEYQSHLATQPTSFVLIRASEQ